MSNWKDIERDGLPDTNIPVLVMFNGGMFARSKVNKQGEWDIGIQLNDCSVFIDVIRVEIENPTQWVYIA